MLGIGDIFPPSALVTLGRQCRHQIAAEKRKRYGGKGYDPARDEDLNNNIATLGRWSFGQNEARVRFDPYAIGSYAEGSYECRFALADIRALALPDAPLPVGASSDVGNTQMGEKLAIYYAAELAPTDNIPPEAPLCYRFLVSGLEEQLQKLKAKYQDLYGDRILTNQDGSKTLLANRKDEAGKEVSYFYSTGPTTCNDYQKHRFGTEPF